MPSSQCIFVHFNTITMYLMGQNVIFLAVFSFRLTDPLRSCLPSAADTAAADRSSRHPPLPICQFPPNKKKEGKTVIL